jgi:hypothetical protein
VGKGENTFPTNQKVVRVNGGYYQSFGGPHALFLIFHEFVSKGAPLFLGNGHLWLLAKQRGSF